MAGNTNSSWPCFDSHPRVRVLKQLKGVRKISNFGDNYLMRIAGLEVKTFFFFENVI